MSTNTYRSRAADRRVADDTVADRNLMCAAEGCPNRWSVDMGKGRLCSAHAWSDKHLWAQITQEQADAETDRARAAADVVAEPPKLSFADKRQLQHRLRSLCFGGQSRAGLDWARDLKAAEERGEKLSAAVRQMWRDALSHRPTEVQP